MSQHFDLIVIGAGMAGIAAANKCAAQGWEVAIVDRLAYGGRASAKSVHGVVRSPTGRVTSRP